ncbi:mas-related G-protein coupled receptor member H-like [Sylvia atricapilla]|uniref:mas-related G-protein coupled receptor member H-like n=1 Tax=Sylvia atricapilla TaxID=48155 RepID=UPI003395D8E9
MEVTTVSPSPASATEGDDVCETDVTNVAIHSVTLLICLCGLLGNGAVLCLLSPEDHNIRIFELAFADFLFLVFTVPAALLFLVEDVSCSPLMPLLYVSFIFQLPVVSCYWMLYRLTKINRIVEVVECCCHCKFPKRLLWLVLSVKYWSFFALLTVIPAVTNLCPSHQQEHCRAALISMYTLILLLFVAPVVISSTIDFIKALRGSKTQKAKRHNIIFYFILLLVSLLSLFNFLQQLGYTILASQVLFLINGIQTSMKPFIYFFCGRCWSPCSLGSLRSSLQRVFDEQKEETAHSSDAPKDTGN